MAERADTKPVILRAEEISKSYRAAGQGMGKTYQAAGRKRKPRIDALKHLSLRVNEGECRGIVGESGCGKSTLLRILAGLERADDGYAFYREKPVSVQMQTKRNEIQMIFQNSMNAVNPYISAESILGEPLKNFGRMRGRAKKEERRECAAALLARVGLSAGDLGKYPGQFSGGQLQRLCIARALAAEPKVLLLDEPLSSLDVSVQAQIMRLLEKLGKENGLTQVLVSHDLEAVYYLSDSLSVMYGGCIVEELEDIQCFDQLCHPYTRRLVQASQGEWPKGRAETDKASVGEACCPYVRQCPDRMGICGEKFPPLKKYLPGHWVRCFRMV